MRTRAFGYAWVALVAALPTTALAVVVVQATVPATVVAGSPVQISCYAEGRNASGMTGPETMQYIDVSVASVPPGGATGTITPTRIPGPTNQSTTCVGNGASCNFIQGSVTWTVPAAAGTFTATCTAAYKGGFTGNTDYTAAGSTTFTTTAPVPMLPPVVSAVSGPSQVPLGTSASYSVTASDANGTGQPLTYEWRATGGTIVRDAGNHAVATWTAPETPGTHTITVRVSQGFLFNESPPKTVNVVVAEYQAGLPVALRTPSRLAAAQDGTVYVVDPGPEASGRIALLTVRGEARGFTGLAESPVAAAYGAGYLWVTTVSGNLFKVDPRSGKIAGKVPLADGRFSMPNGIAYEPTRMQLWVADAADGRVRIVGLDGRTVRVLSAVAGAAIRQPIDVAFDGGGRALVLSAEAKRTSELQPGEPAALARFVHRFDLDGNYLDSYGTRDGQITRAGGLAVGPLGRVYVSDTFQGQVVVLESTGASVGTIGQFGSDPGQLKNPMGLAFMSNGDLAVANTTLGRVDRFGSGVDLPICANDADCDGLPDQWELDHLLNPLWAGDSLLDLDEDGLTNLEEYALGTDPRNRDTDGDGFSDGDEVLAGFDPRNPNDHRPTLAAYAPATSPPGLVRLSAVASGAGTCTVSWTQTSGPTVALRAADSANASFVARTAATYGLEASAVCGGAASLPARVSVEVTNVPPIADAGRMVVTWPGAPIRLGAGFSTDANGDVLTFSWDQSLGPATSFTESGAVLSARPRGPGYYAYQVAVADPRNASAAAEVPVLVAAGPVPTAIVTSYPAVPAVGTLVALDATASVVGGGAPTFAWSQVAGPPATLAGADQPVASFQPSAPGRHVFQVSIEARGVRSPPGRIEVFVAGASGLPTVGATASAAVVAVNAPVTLEATGSTGGLGYRWTQVAGPAAGLTDSDAAVATAVPFAPGFHVFEVSAVDGATVSRPVRVAFEARAGGRAIPTARAAVPGLPPVVDQLVFLDGRQSTGAVNYRWTQLEGPWVVLGGQASVTSFRAHAPGRYVFELEVDDGAIRSAPARVEVNVSEQGVQ